MAQKRPIPCPDLPTWLSWLSSAVVPGVWHGFGCIFSTRDLGRNLRMRWRIRTTFDDVIYTYIRPYPQLKIYWVLRGLIFLSRINFTKKYFSKVRLISDSTRRDLSKEPIKSWGLFKNCLRFNSVFEKWPIASDALYVLMIELPWHMNRPPWNRGIMVIYGFTPGLILLLSLK